MGSKRKVAWRQHPVQRNPKRRNHDGCIRQRIIRKRIQNVPFPGINYTIGGNIKIVARLAGVINRMVSNANPGKR